MQKNKTYLSVCEVAEIYGVSKTQVIRWVQGGFLRSFRPGGIGHHRFCADEIERFERENTGFRTGGAT